MFNTYKKALPSLYKRKAVSTYKKKEASGYPILKMNTTAHTIMPTTTLDKRFEMTTGGHNKYWEIKVLDNGPYYASGYRFNVEIKYGKMDTRGMSSNKDFTSQKACMAFVNSKINEKTAKGYVEVGAGQATAPAAFVPTKATLDSIRGDVRLAINNIVNSMPAGATYEAIVTVIVGGEVIQETMKK